MFNALSSVFGRLIAPIVLLFLTAYAANKISLVSNTWRDLLLDALPMLAMVIAFILSIQFNRSRFSFVLLFLLTAAYSMLNLKSKIGWMLPTY